MDAWKLEPAHDHGLPLGERVKSVRREGGLPESAGRSVGSAFTKLYLHGYHRLTINGQQHLPAAGPFVLIANHASHLDALVLASAVPWHMRDQLFPIAAGDTFFTTPLTGLMASVLLNALPMWRRKAGAHALKELRDRLVNDHSAYILFPEGTRTRDGHMGEFKPGLGMLVAGTKVPVVPCHIAGTFEAWPATARLPKPGKLRLSIGEPITFEQTGDDKAGWLEVARVASNRVRATASG